MNPLEFIKRLNEIFPEGYAEMSGGCFKFSALLKKLFKGESYYNGEHCITKIAGKYYDITGIVSGKGYLHSHESERIIKKMPRGKELVLDK